MRLASTLAIRYLITSRSQTLLMVLLVFVGSLVYVFITSLLTGVQRNAVNNTLGTISHVTVKPLESVPVIVSDRTASPLRKVIQRGMAVPERISEWQGIVSRLAEIPGVKTVSPLVSEPGFAVRGSQSKPITLLGVDPARSRGIIDLESFLVEGKVDVSQDRAVIGTELSRLLGVSVGDRIVVNSSSGVRMRFQIAGIFETGSLSQNERSFYCSIENAQRASNLVGYLNAIEISLFDVFDSDVVTRRAQNITGLRVVPWTVEFAAIEGTIRQINMTKNMWSAPRKVVR